MPGCLAAPEPCHPTRLPSQQALTFLPRPLPMLAQHSVSGLVQLAACLPEEVRCGEVISTFADLCDDKVWSVRQDCATGLAAMASGLPREAVRDRLLPLWQKLSADVSAWAAAAAKRQAGQLLASIHPDDCTDGEGWYGDWVGVGMGWQGWKGARLQLVMMTLRCKACQWQWQCPRIHPPAPSPNLQPCWSATWQRRQGPSP